MIKLDTGAWFFGFTLPAILVGLDQATKHWILRFFNVPTNMCELNQNPGLFHELGPIIDWALVCNPGISFGLFGGDTPIKRWALTLLAAGVSVALFFMICRTKDNLTRFSLSLIIGGAIGNGIDRFLYGAVIDFISVHDLIPFFPWVFNLADSAISCGVIGLLLAMFFEQRTLKN